MEKKGSIRAPLLEKFEIEETKGTEMKPVNPQARSYDSARVNNFQNYPSQPQSSNYPGMTALSTPQNQSPAPTAQPQVLAQPPQQQVIPCAGCRALLSYPLGALCVKCPMCGIMTAVQPIGQIKCSLCRTSLIYPMGAPYVSCTCGLVFSVGPPQQPSSV
ncbi:unnamed protein product [Blepharisma stoltei]|uniref:Zinc finger LSD1-type domain-containing protein n=1 Tax=Blepharisma stoltei TaxID=1481888 RepID=A0AAU9JDU1_9CILI|nr:unnamed protein product [Blepharisma stoltei]